MQILHLLLLLFAFVSFVMAGIWTPADPLYRRLIAFGLAALTASMIPW